MDWTNMTNEQALADWDAGKPVWTCSMGGLGDGYEMAIQVIGFVFLSEMLADPFDYNADDAQEKWRSYIDKIEGTRAAKLVIESVGPSGAQFGAAMNLASVFARQGYAKGMDMVPADRRIQLVKQFPVLAG